MVLVAISLMMKTFFYLRVLNSMSFLVSMLKQVFLDLRPFLLFLILLITGFTSILSIIDWG